MKQAVCVVILNFDKVLAVSRRGELASWGLPGGKADLGETLKQALIREVKEETHCILDENLLEEIYSRKEGEYSVVTYLYKGIVKDFKQGDAGPVSWVTWDDLIKGPFGDYNKEVKLKVIK